MGDKTFSKLSDDVVLKILYLLEDDPRSWARLCCVCKKFSLIIPTVCCKSKCISTLPSSLSNDIISNASTSSSSNSGSHWSSLYKVAVCCPGLLHSGVLLDNSDFGLFRELGPDEDYHNTPTTVTLDNEGNCSSTSIKQLDCQVATIEEGNNVCDETWTLYDDLYLDTVYDNSESASVSPESTESISTTPMNVTATGVVGDDNSHATAPMDVSADIGTVAEEDNSDAKSVASELSSGNKKRKLVGSASSSRLLRSHLASGVWNLSREQGHKLLASRFREDCLYISDWPGCIHMEQKRNYMVFRGVFRNFKRSKVWRTINDGNSGKMDLKCAFCGCKEIWDLHSAFCLKRGFGFHDDGQPVVRAYVCENGHVSGAWTDLPLYA